jgi:hypothetical protein
MTLIPMVKKLWDIGNKQYEGNKKVHSNDVDTRYQNREVGVQLGAWLYVIYIMMKITPGELMIRKGRYPFSYAYGSRMLLLGRNHSTIVISDEALNGRP